MIFKQLRFQLLAKGLFGFVVLLVILIQMDFHPFKNVHQLLEDEVTVPNSLSQMLKMHSHFRLKQRERYSQVDCIRDPFQAPRCLFANVGFRNNSIIFYENPLEPVTYIDSGSKYDFPSDYLRIRSGPIIENNHKISVIKVQEPIPTDAHYVPKQLVYLMNPYWPENPGHWLVDDLFASFVNLLEWGVYSNDFQYVITRGCDGYFPPTYFKQWNLNCREFYLHRTKGITKSQPLFLNENIYTPDSEEYIYNQHQMDVYRDDVLFFQNVLMGQSSFSLSLSAMKHSFHWNLFRTIFLANSGLTLPPIQTQQITIIKKTGRRNVLNYDEIFVWIREIGLNVVVLNPLERTWKEQLSILAQTTVLVTPPGGVAFIAGFLPPQSVGIVFDAWIHSMQTSSALELHWWESLSAFKFLRYSYNHTEAVFPQGLNDDKEIPKDIQKGCSIVGDPTPQQLDCVGEQYTNINLEKSRFMKHICESLILARHRFGFGKESVPPGCQSV